MPDDRNLNLHHISRHKHLEGSTIILALVGILDAHRYSSALRDRGVQVIECFDRSQIDTTIQRYQTDPALTKRGLKISGIITNLHDIGKGEDGRNAGLTWATDRLHTGLGELPEGMHWPFEPSVNHHLEPTRRANAHLREPGDNIHLPIAIIGNHCDVYGPIGKAQLATASKLHLGFFSDAVPDLRIQILDAAEFVTGTSQGPRQWRQDTRPHLACR